jgi:hypothetical protein
MSLLGRPRGVSMRRIYHVGGRAKTPRGEFNRYLGKKLTEGGRAVDAKFYLGFDQGEATMNRLRLEKLWARVLEYTLPGEEPAWDAISFEIGKAVAKGAVVYRLPRHLVPIQGEESYVHFVTRYANMCESVIRVVPDDDAYSAGLGVIERERANAIRQRIDPGWPPPSEFLPPVIPVARPDETLHNALNAYLAELDKEAKGDYSTWLGTQIRQARTLKDHHEDRLLGLLDEGAIRAMAKHWEGRPPVKGRAKQVSVTSSRKQWECLVRFLRWLHKSKNFTWRLPEGGLDDIKFRPKTTPEEDAATASILQTRVWTPTQLALLYKHASPLLRCMMLLGLNAGFYPIDIGLAQSAAVRLGKPHPHPDYLLQGEPPELQEEWRRPGDWLMTLRNKTKVYGEFVLWRHSAAAIRWAEGRKTALGLEATPLLLPTSRGTSFTKPTEGGKKPARIANLWSRLVEQAREEDGSLPVYPFSSLRDTGADLIRRRDDTAANLYLRHGKPYKNDSLRERYSNRPFLRLHRELQRVEEVLAPMWEAVPTPFSDAEVGV